MTKEIGKTRNDIEEERKNALAADDISSTINTMNQNKAMLQENKEQLDEMALKAGEMENQASSYASKATKLKNRARKGH